jgi:hypothetical protein
MNFLDFGPTRACQALWAPEQIVHCNLAPGQRFDPVKQMNLGNRWRYGTLVWGYELDIRANLFLTSNTTTPSTTPQSHPTETVSLRHEPTHSVIPVITVLADIPAGTAMLLSFSDTRCRSCTPESADVEIRTYRSELVPS